MAEKIDEEQKDKQIFNVLQEYKQASNNFALKLTICEILMLISIILDITVIGALCGIPLAIGIILYILNESQKVKKKGEEFRALLGFEELKSWDTLIRRNQYLIFGSMMTVTIIGAIIGIPMLLYGIYLHFTRKRTKYF
jgi:hypothetical protein